MGDRVDEFWRWFVAHDKNVREPYNSHNTCRLDAQLSTRASALRKALAGR